MTIRVWTQVMTHIKLDAPVPEEGSWADMVTASSRRGRNQSRTRTFTKKILLTLDEGATMATLLTTVKTLKNIHNQDHITHVTLHHPHNFMIKHSWPIDALDRLSEIPLTTNDIVKIHIEGVNGVGNANTNVEIVDSTTN